jgi:hypothetical protein
LAVKKTGEPPKLPQPPQITRKIAFGPTQAIALPIILLLPLLGLLGFFQTTLSTAENEQAGVLLRVQYPTRLRFRTNEPMEISALNKRSDTVKKLRIEVRRSYFNAFERVTFNPQPQEIDEKSFRFEFDNVRQGEWRRVQVELDGVDAGSHECVVTAIADDDPASEVRFSTFVLP